MTQLAQDLAPQLAQFQSNRSSATTNEASGSTGKPFQPTALEKELFAETAKAIGKWKASPQNREKLASLSGMTADDVRSFFRGLLGAPEFDQMNALVARHRALPAKDISFPLKAVSAGIDGSLVLIIGVQGSIGVAVDPTNPTDYSQDVLYLTGQFEVGIDEGGEVGVVVGFWNEAPIDLGGVSYGWEVEIDDFGGGYVEASYANSDQSGFIGVSVSLDAGEEDGAEGEASYTFVWTATPIYQPPAQNYMIINSINCNDNSESGHDEVYFYFTIDNGTRYRYPSQERLGLKAQAREAWDRYLAVDGSSPWAVEARQHLARLPLSTSEDRFRQELPRLERAVFSGDDTAVRALVDAYRQQTRTTAEVVTLGKWAEAHQRGDAAEGERSLAVARSIAAALQKASGESLLADAVTAIERADAAARARLAEAHVTYLRGRLAYSRRQPAAAEPDLRRAASLFASAADPMALVARYYAACIRYDLNDVGVAGSELTTLLEELRARPSYIALAAQVRWQLALCAMADDDWQTATSLLHASRAGFGQLGERSNGGFLDALLANALAAMGRSDDAWSARVRSFEALSGERQSDRFPTSLAEATTMEIRAGRPEVARSILAIEESVNRADGHDFLLSYGLVRATVLSLYLGDEETALAKARDAEATARGIADPALRERALADASLAHGAAAADRASLTRAIDGYQAMERPVFLPEARLFRARTELRAGNVDAALKDVDAGIAEMERHRIHFAGSVSGRGVFDAGTEIFRLGMRLSLDRGDVAGAFRYAERGRAYFVGKDGGPAVVTAETLQARLAGSGAAVLELVVLPEELVAFCITASSVRVARSAVTAVQLEELVASHENAGRLYDWLIRPSQASIAAARQLIVVPDPVLEGVSFAGLWDAREKRYLIERLAVAVAPSASSLRPETGRRDLQSVTAIALPTGEQGANVALPQASAELREIAGLYRHAVVLGGSSATLEALRTHGRDAAVIHIAGHTERRGRAGESELPFLGPRGSGLEYVSWREVVAMTLRSNPVVLLAACETLQRPPSPQTFALSLGGGFLAAGAPEVVGTLVPVADNDAQALFEDVHRQLRAGFAPAEALRRTQLRALADQHGRNLPWQALALLTNRIPR